MSEIKRKARKEHACGAGCGFPIIKNATYIEFKGKVPLYDPHGDRQLGIEYYHFRFHRWCWENSPGVRAENQEKHEYHLWESEYVSDGYVDCWKVGVPTGKRYCKICGLVEDEP